MPPSFRPARVPDEVLEAFRAVGPTIDEFAVQNGLLIDRYRKAKAAWELRFARRIGGESTITVSYREATGHALDVSAIWWLDDPVSRMRRFRSQKIGVYIRRDPPARLRELLESALEQVDAWTTDDLGRRFGPFPQTPGGADVSGQKLPVR
jgi:hypothetical protein